MGAQGAPALTGRWRRNGVSPEEMAGLGSLVGRGSGDDSERQWWSSNLGGAERGDSAAGDGSSVRRRAGLFAEQRGRGKREGQVEEPARAG
jgi:hypothetical protein